VNDLLTAYLRTLYALRGGRMSPADAMNHLIDLVSAAQRGKTAFVKLLAVGSPKVAPGTGLARTSA
jgi:hypothetical protein